MCGKTILHKVIFVYDGLVKFTNFPHFMTRRKGIWVEKQGLWGQ